LVCLPFPECYACTCYDACYDVDIVIMIVVVGGGDGVVIVFLHCCHRIIMRCIMQWPLDWFWEARVCFFLVLSFSVSTLLKMIYFILFFSCFVCLGCVGWW